MGMGRVLCAAAVLWAAAWCGAVQAAPPPAEAFAAPSAYSDIALSPSGKRLAKIIQRGSLDVLQVWDVDRLDGGPSAEFDFGPARTPNWLKWKGEERLIVSVSVPTTRFDQLVSESRLVAFDAAFKKPVLLNMPPKRKVIAPIVQDNVVAFLPEDPDHILVSIDWMGTLWPALRKIDVRTGHGVTVREASDGISWWETDESGKPVLAYGDPSRGRASIYTVGASGELLPLVPTTTKEDAVFSPQGFDGDPDRLVVRSDHEGGTTGLYVYSPSRKAFVEKIFKDDRFDVANAVFSPKGDRLIAYTFAADQGHIRYLDEAERGLVADLAKQAGVSDAWFIRRTRDGRYGVLMASDGRRATETYWVDTHTKTLKSLGRYSPAIDQVRLGQVFPVSYKARDGLIIPAYVTLPPGFKSLEEAKGLPFVVMPHGGPNSRDTADFDWWAQFVATRGYGVLQPNFRGSTGYGEAFREAGNREWGEAIQGDVADGARWLVAQGLADPARMCMAGGSFGGYVAMMAAVENTDLFRCAAATAGVSDLPALYEESWRFHGAHEQLRKLIGGQWSDRKRLIENSPARRSREVAMPLLLVHGTLDDVVPVAHSRKMRDRLKRAGKPYEYLELDLADHSLSREKDRLQFLRTLEAFLARHLGPGAPAG